jgi:DegV family protein with EDD domain
MSDRKKIQVIIDSTVDMADRLKDRVKTVPLIVSFGDREYLDGIDLSRDDFYRELEAGQLLPKTSQPSPASFEKIFEEIHESGEEGIVITVASKLSGTYQSACLAAQMFDEGVTVIDTKQFCISEYIIVERAVQLRDEGKNAGEIANIIREEMKDAHVIAVFNTLEYLKLGGRMSAAAAAAGNLLAIKPVLTIEEGIVKLIGKARGSRRSNNLLSEAVTKLGGIDFSRPLCLGYAGFNDELLQKYMKDSAYLYEGHEDALKIAEVGATIGTYSGPGAIALAFFAKK